jgi:hypothetical protein
LSESTESGLVQSSIWIDDAGPPLIHEQGETEDDLSLADRREFDAAVSATDWTVETIVNQMRKGRVDLDPKFQRRNAWLDTRKSQLIESMILRYPIPQLVLAETPGKPGTYFVIDGKQRLLALRQFCVDPSAVEDSDFVGLRLTGLDILRELNHLTWSQVQTDHPEIAAKFENHTIRTVFLSKWGSDDLLLSLFLRLNTGSVVLSPQELRQALIPGDFVDWIDLRSGESPGMRSLLGNTQPDRRMIDAELLLRFIAFNRTSTEYKGNLKSFLDDTCRHFNGEWVEQRDRLEDALNALEASINTMFQVFEGHPCRKWTKTAYERPFNRAIFDIQAFAFGNPAVRDAVDAGAGNDLAARFRWLCDNHQEFAVSITTTTKTIDAFRVRFSQWRNAVLEATGVTLEMPEPLASK